MSSFGNSSTRFVAISTGPKGASVGSSITFLGTDRRQGLFCGISVLVGACFFRFFRIRAVASKYSAWYWRTWSDICRGLVSLVREVGQSAHILQLEDGQCLHLIAAMNGGPQLPSLPPHEKDTCFADPRLVEGQDARVQDRLVRVAWIPFRCNNSCIEIESRQYERDCSSNILSI